MSFLLLQYSSVYITVESSFLVYLGACEETVYISYFINTMYASDVTWARYGSFWLFCDKYQQTRARIRAL